MREHAKGDADRHAPCPYRGLQPYTAADARYFFGREQDAQTIAANLLSASLAVLYGPSGVGKSSILRAGVGRELEKYENVSFTVFEEWQSTHFLDQLIDALVIAPDGSRLTTHSPTLDEAVALRAEAIEGHVILAFDQFEEYFQYHGPQDAEDFEKAVARLANADCGDFHLLFALREDSLASLDRFRPRIPDVLARVLPLTHLDRAAGKEAILGPLRVFSQDHCPADPVTAEDEFVQRLLDDVRVGAVQVAETGQGVTERARDRSQNQIETPYLQLVLERMWETERGQGSRRLRFSTFHAMDKAPGVVKNHLERVMKDLSPAAHDLCIPAFKYLVTPAGRKIAYSLEELSKLTGKRKEHLGPLLTKLASGDCRILRALKALPGAPTSPRYEIYHDVLAAPVLHWQQEHTKKKERRKERDRAAAERKQLKEKVARSKRLAKWAIAATVVMMGLVVLFLMQRGRARSAELDANEKTVALEATTAKLMDTNHELNEGKQELDDLNDTLTQSNETLTDTSIQLTKKQDEVLRLNENLEVENEEQRQLLRVNTTIRDDLEIQVANLSQERGRLELLSGRFVPAARYLQAALLPDRPETDTMTLRLLLAQAKRDCESYRTLHVRGCQRNVNFVGNGRTFLTEDP